MTYFPTGFDPYRKWLGIPEDRRPPTYYDILGINRGENDDDAIRSAAQQRRAFIQSKRGEGHDKEVAKILQEIDESVACLLVPSTKNEYDRRLGITGKQNGKKENHPLPPWFDYFPVRIYGEGSGLISSVIAIVAVIGAAFALMLWFSFQMPWGKISQRAEIPSVTPLPDTQSQRAESNQNPNVTIDQGRVDSPPSNQQTSFSKDDEGLGGVSAESESGSVEHNEHLVGSTLFRGHRYKVFREAGLDWTTAKNRCDAMGGHLATISDEEENKFLVALATKTIGDINNSGVWLGATDERDEGQWKWLDGTQVSYTNWIQGQGNNGNRNENYLLLLLYFRGPQGKESRGWVDQPMAGKTHVIYYACEWDFIEKPIGQINAPVQATSAGASQNVPNTWTDLIAKSGRPSGESGWVKQNGSLLFNGKPAMPLVLDEEFPMNYELELEFQSREALNQLAIILPVSNGLTSLVLRNRRLSSPGGLEMIDGKTFFDQPTSITRALIPSESMKLRVKVTSSENETTVEVLAEDGIVYRWQGNTNRLSPGRLHGDLPAENDLLHVVIVPSGVEPLVLDSALGRLFLLEQS